MGPVRTVPGATALTRIPSTSRLRARFLVTLARAALAAVYADKTRALMLAENAVRFTIRPHPPFRNSGRLCRMHRTAVRTPGRTHRATLHPLDPQIHLRRQDRRH